MHSSGKTTPLREKFTTADADALERLNCHLLHFYVLMFGQGVHRCNSFVVRWRSEFTLASQVQF